MRKNTQWMLAVILAAMLTVTAATVGCSNDAGTTDGTASGTVTDAATDPATDTTSTEEDSSADPGSQDTSAVTDTDSNTTAGDPGVVEPVENDDPILLSFNDDYQAQATVLKEREMTILTSSSSITIRGEGSFTVRYEGENGTETAISENGELTIDSSAAPHAGMVLTVSSESRIELTFSLNFDLGHENNPHIIAPEGATTITFKKDASVRIQTAGWYSFDNDRIDVTNFTADESGWFFLPVGVHGLSFLDGGEITLTLTLEEVPDGYSTETPAVIANLDEPTSLKLYSGAILYYSYTAPETGMYTVAMGAEGKSVNCRFTTSLDGYSLYYGRYYDGEEWLTCEGGRTSTVFLTAGQPVIVAVDYSLSENLVGNDDVAVVVSAAGMADVIDVTELGDNIEGSLAAGGEVFYRFTASEKGVYTVNLGAGATNKASHFTTDLDGSSYAFGETKRMSLEEGQTVYIIVSADGDTAGRVSVQVNRLTDEPLPADGWVSGTYEGKGTTLILDRDAKSVSMGAQTGIKLTYLDGQATFVVDIGGESTEYGLHMSENGTDLVLSYYKDDQQKEITLVYQAPVDPVNIDRWAGVFSATAEDGSTIKLTVYDDGSGMIGTERYSITDSGCSYNTERNILAWYGYTMTIDAQDANGRVTRIAVATRGATEPTLYTLTDEAVVRLPENLPIEQDARYEGEDGFDLFYQGSYQQFNDRHFTIVGHPAENEYIIAGYDATEDHNEATYRLVFNGESVVVYDAEDILQDVLTRVKATEIPNLKADGTREESVAVDASEVRYFRAPRTGWYTFSRSGEGTELFVDCTVSDEGKPSVMNWNTKIGIPTAGTTVRLTAGAVIGIYNGSVTATYSETEPLGPAGSANNPYVMENKTLDVTHLISKSQVFYVSYTAPADGTYEIGFNIDRMHFVVNGIDYGMDFGWSWQAYDSMICTVELTAGETVTIALNRPTSTGDDAVLGIAPQGTLSDILAGEAEAPATGVTSFTEEQQGTYEYRYESNWDSLHYTLTLNANGTVDMMLDYGYDSISLSGATVFLNGDTYSFTYEYYGSDSTATFTINADGSISFMSNEYDDEVTMTVGGGADAPATEALFSAEEQGYWADENWDHVLAVYEDGILYASGDDEYEFGAEDLEKSLDGLYWTFTCNGEKAYFRLAQNTEDGTFYMHFVIGDETLTLTSIY